jgi:hypothetical protein
MSLRQDNSLVDDKTGGHLASTGPYQTEITSLYVKFPNLSHRDWKVPKGRECLVYTGRVTMLEFNKGAQRRDFQDWNQLDQFLGPDPQTHSHNRLFILESLDPNFVRVLGGHFKINPMVFMRQQRTALWEFGHEKGNTPGLPSSQDQSQSFMMEYCELRSFCGGLNSFSMRCTKNNRHISVSRERGKFNEVGIVHRKASFWSGKKLNQGWDGE